MKWCTVKIHSRPHAGRRVAKVCQPARLLRLDVRLPRKNCCLWATSSPGREWNHDTSLDWHLLEGADNWHHVQRLVRDLNPTYRHHKALHELDFDPYGFEWLVVDDHERSVFVFVRRDKAGNEIIVASNLRRFHVIITALALISFGINQAGKWREILNTDSMHYHGSNAGNGGLVQSDAIESHGRPNSLSLTLPPLGTIWLVREANDAAYGR